MRRLGLVMLVLGALACGPRPAPAPAIPTGPPNIYDLHRFTYADSYAAIDQAFARFGPAVVACAHRTADGESGHWWASYRQSPRQLGLMQLSPGWWGSILAASATLHRPPSWYDPYLNAWAAAIGYDSHVGSPTDNVGNWAGWQGTPSECR